MYRVICIAFAPICLWLVLVLIGLDRFTTVAVHRSSVLIVTFWAVAVFCLTLRSYVYNKEPTDAVAKVKRDSKPAWIAAGILGSAILAALSAVCADRLLRAAAQHLPGARREVSGEIIDIRAYRGRGTCKLYARVATFPSAEALRFCVEVNVRAAIGPADLEPGERITLHLKDNALGTVALEFERE
jgi:hypothetical protein